eukprot:TRINITY_DN37643_c0_g1_i5.p1 TRINITY_DN37643_c0_g1~~TRINITY_DN37643_c0_g1_i5.p1  ORF type:complete len:152 (+),score=13.57 TRINITY_DN37643_c0_g1_i5:481-936(+)
MPALCYAMPDTIQLFLNTVHKHIDQMNLEIVTPGHFDQPPVFTAGQNGFDADRLMHPDRSIQPCLYALYRRQIGVEQGQAFGFLQSNGQKIGIDNPDRPVESDKIITAINGAFARSIRASNNPQSWTRRTLVDQLSFSIARFSLRARRTFA